MNKLSILNGWKYFYSGILQYYLVSIWAKKYIKVFSGTTCIYLWKSNKISEKNTENITKSGKNFPPTFVNHYLLTVINFNGHCIINNNLPHPPPPPSPSNKKKDKSIYFFCTKSTVENFKRRFFIFLFESVELNNNTDLEKYIYSCYGIGFDSRSEFSLTDGSIGKNVVVFGVDMSSSVHIDNENKGISILGEGPTQGLDDNTLTAEDKDPKSFTLPGKRYALRLHYDKSNNFLLVNATKIYEFKAKDFMKLKKSVIVFMVGFNPFDTNCILDIHRYLLKT